MVNGVSSADCSTSTSGVVNKGSKRKQTKCDNSHESSKKAAWFNTFVSIPGQQNCTIKPVTFVPTKNGFEGLNDDDDGEIIIEAPVKSPKVRNPPITIFDQSRQQILEMMKSLSIDSFSLKNLRHRLQLYCSKSDDFKIVRNKMREDKVNNYSHDSKDEKLFKVALIFFP